jgi:hypothetical protein
LACYLICIQSLFIVYIFENISKHALLEIQSLSDESNPDNWNGSRKTMSVPKVRKFKYNNNNSEKEKENYHSDP